MTKKSKANKKTPKTPTTPEIPERHYCSCRKHYYKNQKGNFLASQSPFYKGNNGYLTVCNQCLEEAYDRYKENLSDKEALQRICQKFDIYWSEKIYESLNNASTTQSRLRAYVRNTNLYQYLGRTYDTTIEEMAEMEAKRQASIAAMAATLSDSDGDENVFDEVPDITQEEITLASIDPSVFAFWGPGFEPKTYLELESRRKYWMSQFSADATLTPGEEALLRQICNLELTINSDMASGNEITKNVNALNTLLGSLNMKPAQQRDGGTGVLPFGVEIAEWEKEKPVLKIDPDFEDIDGVRKEINAWYLGHLCKMAQIKNSYNSAYEDEIKKYTLERPEFSDADEEDVLDALFGGDSDE